MKHSTVALFWLSFALVPLFAMAAAPSPRLTFESNAVVASGFHPSSSIVIVGVAWLPTDDYAKLARYQASLHADASGAARYAVPNGVAPHSVWAAVDQNTTEYIVDSPGRAPVPENPLALAVGLDAAGDPTDTVTISSAEAFVLLVQPGLGAWTDSISRHGPKDDNRGPGGIAVSVKRLRSIDKNDARRVDRLHPGDVLIAVEPQSLRVFASRLTGPAR